MSRKLNELLIVSNNLPKDNNDAHAYLGCPFEFKHLMKHPLVFVFSDVRLNGLDEHVEQTHEQNQKITEVFGLVHRYKETVSLSKYCEN